MARIVAFFALLAAGMVMAGYGIAGLIYGYYVLGTCTLVVSCELMVLAVLVVDDR